MKETMTVHKALSELKVLGERIEKEIGQLNFLAVNKHSNAKINGMPVADYMNGVKDKYKSVMTLINRRNAIKRAVTKSNAWVTVTIGKNEYTVAEAIDMKNFGMNYQRGILSRLESQWRSCQQKAEQENGDRLDRRADEYIKSLYETADMKNMSDEIKKVREAFVESQMVDVLDPIGAEKTMTELKNTIDSFMSEVDSALSVSNALTTIDVEYETL